MEEAKQPLFAAILWNIWCARNECIWENKQVNPVTSYRLALDIIRHFNWCRNMLNTDPSYTYSRAYLGETFRKFAEL
jgi:hypothetical protein